jgi:hypothetical protein
LPLSMSYQSSLQVPGHLCERFVTRYFFMLKICQHIAQPPSWRTTPCQLSATAYSIDSQLPSILETVPLSATRGRPMPCWQGPTYNGKNCNGVHNYIKIPRPLFWDPAGIMDSIFTRIFRSPASQHQPTYISTRLPRLLSIAEAKQLPRTILT